MLLSFSVENYLSFKGIQTLSFIAEPLKELKENLHIPYLYNHEDRILKSVAIYGHNSYGKSNFIKSFQFLQSLIFKSFSLGQTQQKIDLEPFRLNTSMADKPCFFEVVFLIKDIKYRYRLSAVSDYVVEEGLYYAESRVRENYLFERRGQDIKVSKGWNKEANSRIEQATSFTKPHILFLSVLNSQDGIPKISEITSWFNSNIVVPDDYLSEVSKARVIYSHPDYTNLILRFINHADLGFNTIFDKVEALSKSAKHLEKGLINMWFDREINNFELYTKHTVFDQTYKEVGSLELELQKNESAGTIKYFVIVCLLAYAIKNSQVIWIDELDARFDSSLLEMLIKSFHDPKINPVTAQLIFTTHNTVLLDRKLRRDQMFIVEKNEFGESSLKRMHSAKKPIRIGKSVEKEYRSGGLGGVSKKLVNPNAPTLFDIKNDGDGNCK